MNGGNRRHLLNAIDQGGDLIAKFLADICKRNPLLTNSSIQNRGHQAGLVQMQLRQHLGHFNTDTETAGAGRPQAIFPERLQINLSRLFAGSPELVNVVQMCLRGNLAHPALNVYLAVAGHCVVFANFYHNSLVVPDGSRSHP